MVLEYQFKIMNTVQSIIDIEIEVKHLFVSQGGGSVRKTTNTKYGNQ